MKGRYLFPVFLFLPLFAARSEPLVVDPKAVTNAAASESAHVWSFTLDDIDVSKPDAVESWRPVAVPGNPLRLFSPVPRGRGLRGWYRLRFILPPSWDGSLAIRLGQIMDADRTYLNGKLIGSTGELGTNTAQAYSKVRIYSLPGQFLKPGANDLLVEVCGYFDGDFGLYRDNFLIGPESQLRQEYSDESAGRLASSSIALSVGLYFLLLFLRQPSSREYLWFGLLLTGMGLYQILRNPIVYTFPFSFLSLKRAEYLLMFFLAPACVHFAANYVRDGGPLPFRWVRIAIGTADAMGFFVAGVTVAVTDPRVWSSINQIIYQPLLGVYFFLVFVLLGWRVHQGNKEALAILLAAVVSVAATAVDVLANRGLLNIAISLPHAFLTVILSTALVLSNRFLGVMRKQSEMDRMASIGQMAAGIIHDLKTPMGIIRGFAEMAGDDDFSKEEKEKFLSTIADESDRLAGMVQDILDFARGEMILSKTRMDAESFFESIRRLVAPSLAQKNVTLELLMRENVDLHVDAARFRRAVLNLINNAIEAIGESGHIKLAIGREGDRVSVSVSDNGPGMPPIVQRRLFTPFVTTKPNGTGLGLSIVRRIVEEHDGTIACRTSNTGTTFDITLPA